MRVAILEGEQVVRADVCRLMVELGHTATGFRTGKTLMKALRLGCFDMLLLDWPQSDTCGVDVLEWVRENLVPSPPIIIISTLTADAKLIAGLDAGADDYVTKPIVEKVLIAKVDALLRRTYHSPVRSNVETYGEHAFNIYDHSLTIRSVATTTTIKEFDIALLLFRNSHRALSRSYIMDEVWDHVAGRESRTLDAHVSQIRSRLGLDLEHGVRLSSVYGFGYRLERVAAAA